MESETVTATASLQEQIALLSSQIAALSEQIADLQKTVASKSVPIEQKTTYSLSEAAKLVGVGRATLKRWLAADLAIVIPRVVPRGKVLIRERDLERVIEKRTAKSDWRLVARRRTKP